MTKISGAITLLNMIALFLSRKSIFKKVENVI